MAHVRRATPAVLLALWPTLCFAAAIEPPRRPSNAQPIVVPFNRLLARKLEAARDYIRTQDWPQAIPILQAFLDRHEDSFLPAAAGRGKQTSAGLSVRAEAERLLAELPAAGRDFYRLTYEPIAGRLVRSAQERGDLAGLHEAVRRFRFTAAGRQALDLLGTHYLDRGQHDLAAVCFRRLLEQEGARPQSAHTLLRAILALHGATSAGDRELLQDCWKQLSAQIGSDGLPLGPRSLGLEELRQVVARRPRPGFGLETPLFRRDPARTGQGRAGVFVLEPLAYRDTTTAEGRGALRQALPETGTVWPAGVPLALGGKIIYRGQDGLHAVNAETGKPLWHTPSPLSLSSLMRDPGKKVQLVHWLSLYRQARQPVLLENTNLGTLASDGQAVYAVEDLPVPPPLALLGQQGQQEPNQPARRPALGPLRHHADHNFLRALEAETGRVLWQIDVPGRARPGASLVEQGACFLGPPLPVGDRLFVLADVLQDVQLLCLEAASGRLLWRQPLVGTPTRIAQDGSRRIQACPLAQAGGILVCPTSCGAVLGVDLLTGSLRWAHLYRTEDQSPPDEGSDDATVPAEPLDLLHGWKLSAPVIAGDRIVFTAPDCPDLVCLRLQDGQRCWKSPRREGDLHLTCVHEGRIVVTGEKRCRALRLEDGTPLWEIPAGAPAGQGILCASRYYLPRQQGDILIIDLDRPHHLTRLESRRAAGTLPLGNLVSYGDRLWSQNHSRMTVFPPVHVFLSQVEEQLARRPGDRRAHYERAALRQANGRWAGAVEDLHEVLRQADCAPDLRQAAQDRLHAVLTEWLERDFAAGEKYLTEYRALCRLPVQADTSPARQEPMRREEGRRQMRLHALLAQGRQQQGRILEALESCQELLASATDEPLLPSPDDPLVRLGPGPWARKKVAALLAGASADQKEHLRKHYEERLHRCVARADSRGLLHLALLLEEAPGELGRVGLQAVLRRAELAIAGTVYVPAAETALHLKTVAEQADLPELAGRALFLRAELLARHGQLAEAVACYRRLGQVYPHSVVDGGRRGAEVAAGLPTDRRFLPLLDSSPPWPDHLRGKLLRQGTQPTLRLCPCYRHEETFAGLPTRAFSSWQHRELTFDLAAQDLLVSNPASGQQIHRIHLARQPGSYPPDSSDDQQIVPFMGCDYLVVLEVSSRLFGIDFLEGRILWERDLHTDIPSADREASNSFGVSTVLAAPGPAAVEWEVIPRMSRHALCLRSGQELLALDPLRGSLRWARSDLTAKPSFCGSETLLLVSDSSNGSLQVLQASDGSSTRGTRQPLGRPLGECGSFLLDAEGGETTELTLWLRDLRTGKEVWHLVFPAHSVPLMSLSPDLAGILDPDGTATVLDLAHRDPATRAPHLLPRLRLGRQPSGADAGCVMLADAQHIYVTFPAVQAGNGGPPRFPGLTNLAGTSQLHAYHRETGRLHWSFPTKEEETVLLTHFEDQPVIHLGAWQGEDAPNRSTTLRSIDKRTGKLLFNEKVPGVKDVSFTSLRIDPYRGTIDLVGPMYIWRHSVAR